jgi:hypothetical protein
MNNYFTAIVNLLNTLAEHGFTAQLKACHDGWQLLFPWYEEGDISCNFLTGGKLESFGFPWDNGETTVDTAEGFCYRLAPVWDKATYGPATE